jgi:hypothetical protein
MAIFDVDAVDVTDLVWREGRDGRSSSCLSLSLSSSYNSVSLSIRLSTSRSIH